MKRMKSKLTGEIVQVLGFNFAYDDRKRTMDCIDSKGVIHKRVPKEYLCDLEPSDEAELDVIDWEQRRYEIAKEMLPAVYKNSYQGEHGMDVEEIVSDAILYADELIKQLKGGKE